MAGKIVYHKGYNLHLWGLEKLNLHPFPFDKYKQIATILEDSGRDLSDVWVEPRYDEDFILNYLDPAYRKKLNDKVHVVSTLEVGLLFYIPWFVIRSGLLKPMIFASCGTVEAGFQALEHGRAINLGGGYHHARFDFGHGFCFYPDIGILVKELRKKGIQKIAILDFDAHQGDGTEHCIGDDENILMVDMYMCGFGVFPSDQKAASYIDVNIPVDDSIGDDQYMSLVYDEVLPKVKNFSPEIIIYCAGSDIYDDDPLAFFDVSEEGIITRDKAVWDFGDEHGIPVVKLLCGGYHRDSISFIARSIIENFLD